MDGNYSEAFKMDVTALSQGLQVRGKAIAVAYLNNSV